MYEVDLHVTPRCAGFACAALLVEILAPAPTGRVLFVNHLPQWQLDQEHERELQAAIAARCIEEHIGRRPIHVVLAGDLNATPDAASVRFWTGRQALEGTSVACRDAWASTHPDEPGHTFSPENPAVTAGEEGKWALELRRRNRITCSCAAAIMGRACTCTPASRFSPTPVNGVFGSDHFGLAADLTAFTPDGRLAS